MEIIDGIYVIETPFFEKNYIRCGIVNGKYGLTLIDSGTVATFKQVMDFFREKAIDSQRLRYVIATHGHADHMGANSKFRKACGSIILADVRTVPRCLDYELQFNMFYGAFPDIYFPSENERQAFFALLAEPGPVDFQIKGDETRVDLGDKTLHIFESPGHTLGHIAVYEPSTGCLFTGDSVAWRGPFNEPPYYEDKLAYQKTLEKLIGLDANILIPAHFPIRRGKEVKEFLEESRGVVDLIDVAVLNCLNKRKRPQTLKEITQYVCDHLKKEFMIQGLFTVNTHLNCLVNEGVLTHVEGQKYAFS